MPVRLRASAATDVGSVRELNQDAYLEAPEQGLFVVADGMGGHAAGEVASREAIAAMSRVFDRPAVTAAALADAITLANKAVWDQAAATPAYAGMGCTLTALALLDETHAAEVGVPSRLAIANVGDSRTYLLRDGELTQITTDHSWVQEMVRAGEITHQDAEHHPRRSTLTRALGIADTVDVDLVTVDPVLGDRYVLCSDGLWDEVPPEALASVLRRMPDATTAANELVRQANEAGGRDNITVVVVDVVDADTHDQALAASAALTDELSALISTPAPTPTPSPPPPAGAAVQDVTAGKLRIERVKADRPAQPPLLTWRVGAVVAVLLAIVLGAWIAIRLTAAQGYWVFIDADVVKITHGRPPGTGAYAAENGRLTADKLSEADRIQLERGPRRYATKAEAEQAVFDHLVCNALAAGRFTVPAGTNRTCTSVHPTTSVSFALTTQVPVPDSVDPAAPSTSSETTAPVGP